MKTVLITGCAGFIGSHLCDRFISEGFNVTGIDNLITGSRDNVSRLSGNASFTFIEHDISSQIKIEQKIDLILHFACPASPKDYLKYPVETMKVNSTGTYNVLELAKEKSSRFVFASSSEIYGDPLVHPQKEDYRGNVNPVGPRSVYDESKRFSEALTTVYYNKFSVDTRILRIFNTYGQRMKSNDGRVISNFIYSAIKNENLVVNGDGSQTRSFCYISDMINAVFKASVTDRINGEVLNLGNPEEFSIIELANVIINKTRSKSKIVFTNLPADDPKKRKPDISKTSKLLSWKPLVDLNHGLTNTIEYFRGEILN